MQFIIWILAIVVFASSLKLALRGEEKIGNDIINMLSHPGWSLLMFLFIPMYIGEFAREESSPIPWVEFMQEYTRHGIGNGLPSLLIVLSVELWLFWIPSKLYIDSNPKISKKFKYTIHFLNIAVGLILITPDNPIYNFLGIL